MKYNRRKKTFRQHALSWIKILPFFIALGVIAWGLYNADPDKLLKVNIDWDIEQTLPIEKQLLKQTVSPLISEVYQLNLPDIKHALEQQPWVEKAEVRRLFWNSINIKISSRKVALRWKNKDCHAEDKHSKCRGYIDKNGELFTPKTLIESDVALVISTKKTAVAQNLLKNYQSYQATLTPMKIKVLSKTNIDTLTIEPNIKVILGYQQQHERLLKFIKIYKKLRTKIARAKLNKATYDMRYVKGFSLKY